MYEAPSRGTETQIVTQVLYALNKKNDGLMLVATLGLYRRRWS